MKLYIIIIAISAGIVFVVNAIIMPWSLLWLCFVLIVFGVVGVTALHGAGSAFIYSLRRFIHPRSRYFKVSKKEKRFWQYFGVRKFKDYLPDLGGKLVGFEKRRVANPKDTDYIKTYIHETCVGEIGHIVGGILGFAVMLFMPAHGYWLYFGLPCAIVNLLLAIMPVIAMRYNRHKLVALCQVIEFQNKRNETRVAVKSKEPES